MRKFLRACVCVVASLLNVSCEQQQQKNHKAFTLRCFEVIGRSVNETLAAKSPDSEMHLKFLIFFCDIKTEYLSDFVWSNTMKDGKIVILR